MSKHDPYAGIFDNAAPGDFIVTTTAVHTKPNSFGGFEQFIDLRLDAVRTTFLATDNGAMNPIAHLANGVNVRTFTPDDEETHAEFVARLNREARAMQAEWVFIALATEVGSRRVEPDEATFDPTDASQVGDTPMRDGLVWYAERHQDGVRSHHSGVMWVESGELVEKSNGQQPFPLMSLILDL